MSFLARRVESKVKVNLLFVTLSMLLFSLLLFFSPSASAANLIYVSTSGSDTTGTGSRESPFRTIQKGIDMAASGDTVFVESGTYYERINLKSGINVTASDQDKPVIDGQLGGVVVKAVGVTGVTIRGFTIQNGRSFQEGGGVFVSGSQNVLIEGNTIKNNSTGRVLSNGLSTLKSHKKVTGSLLALLMVFL